LEAHVAISHPLRFSPARAWVEAGILMRDLVIIRVYPSGAIPKRGPAGSACDLSETSGNYRIRLIGQLARPAVVSFAHIGITARFC
jgi:hypothetical protein